MRQKNTKQFSSLLKIRIFQKSGFFLGRKLLAMFKNDFKHFIFLMKNNFNSLVITDVHNFTFLCLFSIFWKNIPVLVTICSVSKNCKNFFTFPYYHDIMQVLKRNDIICIEIFIEGVVSFEKGKSIKTNFFVNANYFTYNTFCNACWS